MKALRNMDEIRQMLAEQEASAKAAGKDTHAATLEDVKKLLEKVVGLSKESIERKGEFAPRVLLVLPPCHMLEMVVTFESTEEKRLKYGAIRAIAEELGALAAVTASDSWMATVEKDDIYRLPASKRKNRQEAVIVTCAAMPLGFKELVTLPYTRKGKRIEWGEEKRSADFEDNLLGGELDSGNN